MNNKFSNRKTQVFTFFIVMISCSFHFQLFSQDRMIKIHLRGVAESKITVMPRVGKNALKPIIEKTGVKNGETAVILLSNDELPSGFVIRYDYKEKATSTPYPSEQSIFVGDQDLEVWVNPPYCNNADSTYFQNGEKENTLLAQFNKENTQRKVNLKLLQNVLKDYSDQESTFYKQCTVEYEKKRIEYNQWINEQSNVHKALFVSHGFQFQYIPAITFQGSELEKIESIIAHYFDGINLKDPLLVNTVELKEWMNDYVNLYGSLSFTEVLRDSLFTLAGKRAIEKASLGDPKVYGWMADYFYNGYEVYGIQTGMTMLQEHINNPNCLTSKKQQINKRIEGIENMKIGTIAPNFIMPDEDGISFDFHAFKGKTPYKLLLFWSADCGHCEKLVEELKVWSLLPENKKKMDIVAVSLDEELPEIVKWEDKIRVLSEWKHLRAVGGVNSKVANDYFILSTPVILLVDTKSNLIKAMPLSLEEIQQFLQ